MSQRVLKRASLYLAMIVLVPLLLVTSSSTANASTVSSPSNLTITRSTSGSRPAPRVTAQAALACETDGAVLSTAMAAFVSVNPTVQPTQARLLGRSDGGPFLKSWVVKQPFYLFSINVSGTLEIAIPAGAHRVAYKGPNSCQKLKSVTAHDVNVVEACMADGGTIAVAMEAFRAENRGVRPTQAGLLQRKKPGPYLDNWAHNAPYYAYRISSRGALEVAIPAEGPWIAFTGPVSCARLVTF